MTTSWHPPRTDADSVWPVAGCLPFNPPSNPTTLEMDVANAYTAGNDDPLSVFPESMPFAPQQETDISYWLQQCGPGEPEPHDETFAFTGSQTLFHEIKPTKKRNSRSGFSKSNQNSNGKNIPARKDRKKRYDMQNLFEQLASKVAPGQQGITRKKILLVCTKHDPELQWNMQLRWEGIVGAYWKFGDWSGRSDSTIWCPSYRIPVCRAQLSWLLVPPNLEIQESSLLQHRQSLTLRLIDTRTKLELPVQFAQQPCVQAEEPESQGCLSTDISTGSPKQEQCLEKEATAALLRLFYSPEDNKANERGLAIQDLIT